MLAGTVVLLFLLPATAACLHYAIGSIVGRFPRKVPVRTPTHRVAVLIPAHNEESTLPHALASLAAADYPAGLLSVLVVADHCTDGTVRQARHGGAGCLVRRGPSPRGKGHALADGMAELLLTKPDAVMVLDADCRIAPGLLRRMDAELADGAKVVQAAVVSVCEPGRPASVVAAVGAAFDNRMAAASDRLGRPAPLRGTGMLFAREILERQPWTKFGVAEDAEYAAELRRHRVPIRFAAGEGVTCEAPPREAVFLGQRRRWSAALWVPPSLWPTGWLASKPLILTHLLVTCFAVRLPAPEAWPTIWAMALGGVTTTIYVDAMFCVGVRWPGLRSIWLVGRLAVQALGSLWVRETQWRPTPR